MHTVTADGAGFPDLLMVRDDRVIVAELKAQTGRVSRQQQAWLDAFVKCHRTIAVAVWRPADWEDGTILRALERVRVTV